MLIIRSDLKTGLLQLTIRTFQIKLLPSIIVYRQAPLKEQSTIDTNKNSKSKSITIVRQYWV